MAACGIHNLHSNCEALNMADMIQTKFNITGRYVQVLKYGRLFRFPLTGYFLNITSVCNQLSKRRPSGTDIL